MENPSKKAVNKFEYNLNNGEILAVKSIDVRQISFPIKNK
jgi:hypothetical protein